MGAMTANRNHKSANFDQGRVADEVTARESRCVVVRAFTLQLKDLGSSLTPITDKHELIKCSLL